MVATVAYKPRLTAEPTSRQPLIVLVGPTVTPDQVSGAVAGRGAASPSGPRHVIALDKGLPLWTGLVDGDPFLVTGAWEFYQDIRGDIEQRRAERRAGLAGVLAAGPAAVTSETVVGSMRAALRRATDRWPDSPVLVIGPWKRLPRHWSRRPDQAELVPV
jgi:hypothetical protein